jgi:hypothetical protein
MEDRFYIGKPLGTDTYEVLSNHDQDWVEEFPFYEEAKTFCDNANRHYLQMAAAVARVQGYLDSAITDLDWLDEECSLNLPEAGSIKSSLVSFKDQIASF